jgi:integrase
MRRSEFIVEVLARHLETAPASEWVFPARQGGHLRYDNFRVRVWDPAVERASLVPLTFHELRHTAAAVMINEGADPLQVQRRLGHKDVGTTLGVYGHLYPNREEELVAALDRVHREAKARVGVDQTLTSNVVKLPQ